MYNPTRPETFDDWWLTAQAKFSNAALLRIVELGRPTRAEVAQVLAAYEHKRRRKGGLSTRRERRIIHEIYETYETDAHATRTTCSSSSCLSRTSSRVT